MPQERLSFNYVQQLRTLGLVRDQNTFHFVFPYDHVLVLQLWPQNMQDIGVCEELVCSDDFDIPDVDMTFQNFEELFGGDQDPIIAAVLHDKDVSYSSVEKGISLDKSDNGNASTACEF